MADDGDDVVGAGSYLPGGVGTGRRCRREHHVVHSVGNGDEAAGVAGQTRGQLGGESVVAGNHAVDTEFERPLEFARDWRELDVTHPLDAGQARRDTGSPVRVRRDGVDDVRLFPAQEPDQKRDVAQGGDPLAELVVGRQSGPRHPVRVGPRGELAHARRHENGADRRRIESCNQRHQDAVSAADLLGPRHVHNRLSRRHACGLAKSMPSETVGRQKIPPHSSRIAALLSA